MDSLITAAARALAAGDPLGALNRIALRDDAPALALRGIAMAQLAELDSAPFPPALRAAHELVVAGIAMRRLRTKTARAALNRAERAALRAGIPALMAEVESAALVMNTPAARLMARGEERPLLLEE